MRKNFRIISEEDLINAVNELGFLPFFKNSIERFSVEEHISPNLWFTGIEGRKIKLKILKVSTSGVTAHL